ncbi:Two-component system response regulator [Streptomyces clavuligerus]|uniref:Two-component system response regulator n=2 Tax=Streptomyces clavuligerus TaxID=1901 RepID=E2PYS3_STRCL|nr:Two-component system response regulator [Streptomyces clavuligerus]
MSAEPGGSPGGLPGGPGGFPYRRDGPHPAPEAYRWDGPHPAPEAYRWDGPHPAPEAYRWDGPHPAPEGYGRYEGYEGYHPSTGVLCGAGALPCDAGDMTTPREGERILIVDDEPAVREALQRSLAFEGYATEVAVDGIDALAKAESYRPDLLVLDIQMPRMDGLTAARRLRATGSTVPVLMLTARDTVGDRVTGLDAGADDYLVKPFELDELFARIRALLRRSSYASAAGDTASGDDGHEILSFADLRMDLATREVHRGERAVELTRTEFTLLELLLAHPRQVLTREQILKSVWGFDFEPTSNSLDVYVMYLRRKTEAGGEPRIVHTVRGVGYVLRGGEA